MSRLTPDIAVLLHNIEQIVNGEREWGFTIAPPFGFQEDHMNLKDAVYILNHVPVSHIVDAIRSLKNCSEVRY